MISISSRKSNFSPQPPLLWISITFKTCAVAVDMLLNFMGLESCLQYHKFGVQENRDGGTSKLFYYYKALPCQVAIFDIAMPKIFVSPPCN